MNIKIKIINNFDDLLENKNIWEFLFNSIGINDLYLHPNWHISWWNTYGRNKIMHIIFLFVDNELIGVLPLAIFRGNIKNAKLKILEFSGSTQSDRNNYLLNPKYKLDGIRIFQNQINKIIKNIDVFHVHSLNYDSELIDKKFLNKKTYFSIKNNLPYINLKNINYYDFISSLKSSHRGDIKRQQRRLESIGKLSLNVYKKRNDIKINLKKFLVIHSIRWNKKIGYKYHMTSNFFNELVDRFNNGIVHFSSLDLDGKPISFHFGFIINSHFYYYKPAYDIRFEKYSPGKVHISKLIELNIESGSVIFDFLLGNEKYKRNWNIISDNSITYYISGGGLLSKFGIWWYDKGINFLRKFKL